MHDSACRVAPACVADVRERYVGPLFVQPLNQKK